MAMKVRTAFTSVSLKPRRSPSGAGRAARVSTPPQTFVPAPTLLTGQMVYAGLAAYHTRHPADERGVFTCADEARPIRGALPGR